MSNKPLDQKLSLSPPPDEGIATLVQQWRETADFAEKHLEFNIKNNNIDDEAQIRAFRECANQLETFWRAVRDGRREEPAHEQRTTFDKRADISGAGNDHASSRSGLAPTAIAGPDGRRAPDWQPIATAPRNGPILACEFVPKTITGAKEFPNVFVAHWWGGDSLNSPRWSGGFTGAPTHWMPLPAPPVAAPPERRDE